MVRSLRASPRPATTSSTTNRKKSLHLGLGRKIELARISSRCAKVCSSAGRSVWFNRDSDTHQMIPVDAHLSRADWQSYPLAIMDSLDGQILKTLLIRERPSNAHEIRHLKQLIEKEFSITDALSWTLAGSLSDPYPGCMATLSTSIQGLHAWTLHSSQRPALTLQSSGSRYAFSNFENLPRTHKNPVWLPARAPDGLNQAALIFFCFVHRRTSVLFNERRPYSSETFKTRNALWSAILSTSRGFNDRIASFRRFRCYRSPPCHRHRALPSAKPVL